MFQMGAHQEGGDLQKIKVWFNQMTNLRQSQDKAKTTPMRFKAQPPGSYKAQSALSVKGALKCNTEPQ
jgi:hypothetical protein